MNSSADKVTNGVVQTIMAANSKKRKLESTDMFEDCFGPPRKLNIIDVEESQCLKDMINLVKPLITPFDMDSDDE